VHLHPYAAAELSRQRRADLLAAADSYRRASALRRQAASSRRRLKMRFARSARARPAGRIRTGRQLLADLGVALRTSPATIGRSRKADWDARHD
jgi:hypothetical protein